ncbi:nitrous oxide-stimulated promoter family protein [Vibrio sp. TBV020]|uniref:nitrous oxide-stimulated promoter family protein n=1 Tax=Vibrio sp. TBV020 TaxID=3137398 RepID=UPI0038CD5646
MSDILEGPLRTEFKTVSAMVAIYCHAHHGTKKGLCEQCKILLEYAETRLDRCPYGQEKPTCNKCPIHCYKPIEKELMRQVMRFSGPRMLLPHPILAMRHLLHERKAVPEKPKLHMSNRHLRKQKK